MISFFRHGSCQVLSKKQIKVAGGVALGWVPLDFIFAFEPFEFISGFIHRKTRKTLKVHPVTKLDMPPTQGKQTALGEKTEKDICCPGTF